MNSKGFALLEVLIALVIIALALGSLIETNTAVIRNVNHFENKTEAIWVAQNVANEIQLGMISLPSNLTDINGNMSMLDNEWYWSAHFDVTADHAGLKTTIDVKMTKDGQAMLQFVTYLVPVSQNNV